ncbi:MAG: hypothetical protein PHS73_04625 [Candidatus Peribacteraceae bacterium]|nr:hypothetical protein [Candidatus Peribacteraceae bacterium]
MSSTFENIKADGAKAMELFAFPIKAAEAGVMKLGGEPFFPKLKHEAATDLWNLMAFPPRILKHLTVGFLKASGRMAWNVVKVLPILPAWSGESDRQKQKTHQQLVALGKDLPTPMPLTPLERALNNQAA